MDPYDSLATQPLERSISQQSTTSQRSNRSTTLRNFKKNRLQGHSQPGSSASSIAASDKSLVSFPSLSPESPIGARFDTVDEDDRSNSTTPKSLAHTTRSVSYASGTRGSIVNSLTGSGSAATRSSLFDDAPPASIVPGALHRADDGHIERLIARRGAVELVKQIAQDLAERDVQIAILRRRADERERALRKIIRECGLSNLELETRLRKVEDDIRTIEEARKEEENGISGLMNDAMGEDLMGGSSVSLGTGLDSTTVGGTIARPPGKKDVAINKGGTARGWKEYFMGSGTGTMKKSSRATSIKDDRTTPAIASRTHSGLDRRPTLQKDFFNPPPGNSTSVNKVENASSNASSEQIDRKDSTSLASKALRLVAGGTSSTTPSDGRGRASSGVDRPSSVRAPRTASTASGRTNRSTRTMSAAEGPRALMAMRRTTPTSSVAASTKTQAQELWGNMMSSPPSHGVATRQESYGPVEMDAILPPESQPPTLTHIYNNFPRSEYLTDRFGFIYDQRRKKRQREAAQVAKHIRKGSRTELLLNGRSGISPNMLEDLPSPKWSVSSEGRPASPASTEDKPAGEEGKPKRWQDYLKIATFPTELLSHTPSMGIASLEVMEAPETPGLEPDSMSKLINEPAKSPAITPTSSGLVPFASTTTALDSEPTQPSETDSSAGILVNQEDSEPVRLLLDQLSEMHDSLQREKTIRWNDFLRKVRAERRREGVAATAAANAAAEARFERAAVILPETRVADGEMIGISGLGNKGKVGRAKWNEFKTLVLGGIPVAHRPKIWSECCGAAALRIPGYYDDLVAQSEDADDDPSVVSQIRMDIHRTLTDNIFFRKGPGVQKLSEVLLAYSRRNQDVGYCQGMNLIAANLLLVMPSAEDAFWILTSIIENILPQGYYDHSLIASRADQQVLRHFVSTVLPRLSAHLDNLSVELEALTFQWFLSVFTDCLCAEALFRVWDVVLCTNDGSTFLFQIAVALLKLNEGNLLQCTSAAAVYTYINHHMTEHAISIDGLIQASDGLKKVVKREDVEGRRETTIQAERDLRNGVVVEAVTPTETTVKSRGKGRNGDDGLTVAEPRPID